MAIVIDVNTGEQKRVTNTFKYSIQKRNGSSVNTCAFHDGILSAVIATSAALDEDYSPKNTVLFLSPFSKNKMNIDQYKGYNYWINERSDEYHLKANPE